MHLYFYPTMNLKECREGFLTPKFTKILVSETYLNKKGNTYYTYILKGKFYTDDRSRKVIRFMLLQM